MSTPKADHRVYLAAALTAAALTNSRGDTIYAAFDTWSEAIETITEHSDALFQQVRARSIVWGETHDQYDVIDRLAELWYATLTTPGIQGDQSPETLARYAIEQSEDHAANRRHHQQEP